MPIWQLCANLLIPNCLRSNLTYSPLAALELYVKNARSESFKKHRDVIQKIIDTHVVDNMIQLLTLFKKLELVTENDIEASEYVRYIIYQSLIERKKQSL